MSDNPEDRPGGIHPQWEPTSVLRWQDDNGLCVLQQTWRHARSGREEWRDVPMVTELSMEKTDE